jgi:hypothetical protein
MHRDAKNELDMYKSMLEDVDETANPEEWEELTDLIRGVQMTIGMLESAYDEVKKEYDNLTREEQRINDKAALRTANEDLVQRSEAAESLMEESKYALENIGLDIKGLKERLESTKKENIRENIQAEIDSLIL